MSISFLGLLNEINSLSGKVGVLADLDEVLLALLFGLIPVALGFSFIIFVIYRSRANQDFKRKETELRLAKAESELKALRTQINPHFIFNSLNSIQHFIHTKEASFASDYLIKFSKLIRYVLESSGKSWVSLEEELEANKIYLELEQLRKNLSFTFQFVHSPNLKPDKIFIPPMLIQPFLENSVWHAVKEEGEIKMSITRSDHAHLSCEISDHGNGDIQKPTYDLSNHVKKSSMGVNLMEERFRIINELRGRDGKFIFEALENGGKRVNITLPFEEDDE